MKMDRENTQRKQIGNNRTIWSLHPGLGLGWRSHSEDLNTWCHNHKHLVLDLGLALSPVTWTRVRHVLVGVLFLHCGFGTGYTMDQTQIWCHFICIHGALIVHSKCLQALITAIWCKLDHSVKQMTLLYPFADGNTISFSCALNKAFNQVTTRVARGVHAVLCI